jgi:hypothetical protein
VSTPRPNPRKLASTPACVVVAALLLAGCGGSSASSPSTTPSTAKSSAKSTATSNAKASSAVRLAGLRRLSRFAACMRAHGVKLPPPNGSGKGPLFDTTGIDTKATAYKSAQARCARILLPGTLHPGPLPGPGKGKKDQPPITLG